MARRGTACGAEIQDMGVFLERDLWRPFQDVGRKLAPSRVPGTVLLLPTCEELLGAVIGDSPEDPGKISGLDPLLARSLPRPIILGQDPSPFP